MANIPGATYVLPGVFGPSGTEIIKTEKGYAIGWNSMKTWGGPFIEGTVREIARDMITKYGQAMDNSDALNKPDYYSAIYVQWKPEIVCSFITCLQVRGFDGQEFLDALAIELKPLAKLLPFA